MADPAFERRAVLIQCGQRVEGRIVEHGGDLGRLASLAGSRAAVPGDWDAWSMEESATAPMEERSP